MITNCPGSDVQITIVECPKCKGEVELFTGDSKAKCVECGTWVPREIASCIDWCPAAEQCYKSVFEEEGRARPSPGAGAAGDNQTAPADKKGNKAEDCPIEGAE